MCPFPLFSYICFPLFFCVYFFHTYWRWCVSLYLLVLVIAGYRPGHEGTLELNVYFSSTVTITLSGLFFPNVYVCFLWRHEGTIGSATSYKLTRSSLLGPFKWVSFCTISTAWSPEGTFTSGDWQEIMQHIFTAQTAIYLLAYWAPVDQWQKTNKQTNRVYIWSRIQFFSKQIKI